MRELEVSNVPSIIECSMDVFDGVLIVMIMFWIWSTCEIILLLLRNSVFFISNIYLQVPLFFYGSCPKSHR